MTAFKYIVPELIRMAAERGDHVYPHANYKPIPEATTQPRIAPRSEIFHTMAGPRSTSPENLWAYMNRGDISGECHVQLGYFSIIQALPFNVRADNNYKANSWLENGVLYGSISVETQDDGADNNVEDDPWNDFQVEHLAGIAAFGHLRYGIPLDRVTDVWTDGGIDGHRAWPEWSKYVGKTCPGGVRWEQIPEVLRLAHLISYPAPEEPDVPTPHQPPLEPALAALAVVMTYCACNPGGGSQGALWDVVLPHMTGIEIPAGDPRRTEYEQASKHPGDGRLAAAWAEILKEL